MTADHDQDFDNATPADEERLAPAPEAQTSAKAQASQSAEEVESEAPEEAEDDEAEEDEDEEEEDEAFDADEEEEALEGEAYHVKLKPELSSQTRQALAQRQAQQRQRPAFRRQEWFRYKRLGTKWRKPKGIHSKQRRGMKYRPPSVKVGYGSHSGVRGLHPSGFEDVLVHRPADLEDLDPATQAARIAGTVGLAKREAIHARAAELGLRLLNPTRRRLEEITTYLALKRGDEL